MRQFQSHSRSSEAVDYNLLSDNANYVQTWSCVQAMVVILCTIVQVETKQNIFLTQIFFAYQNSLKQTCF